MRRLIIVPLLLITTQGSAQPPVESKAKTDLELLQGIWDISSLESNGKPETGQSYKGRFTFSKEKAMLREGNYPPIEYTFSVDPAKTPRTIDLNLKGNTIRGIYKLENEELLLCLSMGGNRPTDFATRAGGDCERFTLKRSKWEKYIDKTYGFSVEMPGKPEERQRKIDSPAVVDGKGSFLVVNSDSDRVHYVVTTVPLKRNLDGKELDDVIETLRKAMLGEVGIIVSNPVDPGKDFKLPAYTVREWTLTTDVMGSKEKGTARIRMFVSGDKLYGLMVIDDLSRPRNMGPFWNTFELPPAKP